jgi:hypothetical protein
LKCLYRKDHPTASKYFSKSRVNSRSGMSGEKLEAIKSKGLSRISEIG